MREFQIYLKTYLQTLRFSEKLFGLGCRREKGWIFVQNKGNFEGIAGAIAERLTSFWAGKIRFCLKYQNANKL